MKTDQQARELAIKYFSTLGLIEYDKYGDETNINAIAYIADSLFPVKEEDLDEEGNLKNYTPTARAIIRFGDAFEEKRLDKELISILEEEEEYHILKYLRELL